MALATAATVTAATPTPATATAIASAATTAGKVITLDELHSHRPKDPKDSRPDVPFAMKFFL